jgi:hypothetical protein
VAGGLYEALSPLTLFEQYAAAEQARNATLPAPVHAAAVSVLRELLDTTSNSTTTITKNTDINSDVNEDRSANGATSALTSVHTSLVLDTVKLVNFGPFHEEVHYFPLLSVTCVGRYLQALLHCIASHSNCTTRYLSKVHIFFAVCGTASPLLTLQLGRWLYAWMQLCRIQCSYDCTWLSLPVKSVRCLYVAAATAVVAMYAAATGGVSIKQ